MGRFLASVQEGFFDAQHIHYPIAIFHSDDLSIGKKRRLEEKTHAALLFSKLDLSPHSLPNYLKRVFGSIVNSTAQCHPDGNLFLPELKGCKNGFRTRMMNRFFAGPFYNHSTLRGYEYILRISSGVRFTSPILFNPFEVASEKKAVFMFRLFTTNSILPSKEHHNSRRFVTTSHPTIVYSSDIQLYKMRHFQTHQFRHLFQTADKSGSFLVGSNSTSHQPNLNGQQFQSFAVSQLVPHTRVQPFPVSLTLSHQP
jgi:hypothetical protein